MSRDDLRFPQQFYRLTLPAHLSVEYCEMPKRLDRKTAVFGYPELSDAVLQQAFGLAVFSAVGISSAEVNFALTNAISALSLVEPNRQCALQVTQTAKRIEQPQLHMAANIE